MNRSIVTLVLLVAQALPFSALAASKGTPDELPDLPLETLYFGGENPVLTPNEQKALKIA